MKDMDTAISNSIQLIITVDCGSSSHEAVRMAHRAGIDVIITDHHTISNPIPEALAVVNPRRSDCPSGAENLAGVGVAFFLDISLRKYLRDRGFWTSRNEPNLKSACDLVALGTVADMVPLTGDNRILVKGGIDLINSRPRPGIQSLLEMIGIQRPFLNSEDIAFKLAPRLNAAGRMAHAKTAARLLLTRDSQKALKLAETLNALNCERRSVEQRVLEMVVDGILDIQDITPTLIDEIESLRPYGNGNPEPVFLAKNIHIASSGIVGRNTRRMILEPGDGSSGTSISAVQSNVDSPLPMASEIREMVYRLRWNFWNGNHTPQILVEDAIFSLQSPMSESIMRIDDGLISVKVAMTYQDP